MEQLALSAVHPVALLYVHNVLYITLPFLEQVAPSAEQLVALQYCTQYTLYNPSLEQYALSTVHPVALLYTMYSM